MSADYLKEAEEASAIRPQRAEESPRHDANGQAEQSTAARNDLLGDSRLRGRGNEPVRVALMQDMQQTHGNRAVQRFVQRSAAGTSVSPDEEVGARIKNASGNGSSLDQSAQHKLEAGMDADLSGVRVHTDSEADSMAKSVDAVAFTSGQDIFFRDGAYNPGSREGMQLLAHEAVHTVQQSQGPVEGTPAPGGISISDPSDRHEQEADHASASIMQGGQSSARAAGGGSPGANVQRQEASFEGREEEQKKKPEEDEAAVQAMRADRYPAVQRAVAEPPVEEIVNSTATSAAPSVEEMGGPQQGEQQANAAESSAPTAATAVPDMAESPPPPHQEQQAPPEPGRIQEQFEDEEERVAERLQNKESSGLASPVMTTTPSGSAAPAANNALRSVFEGSVVTAIKTAHDSLSNEKPDAQAALNSIRQAEGVTESLRSIYKSSGEAMLEARLAALQSNLNLRSLVLSDQLSAQVPLDAIAKGLSAKGEVSNDMWEVAVRLHPPQKSSGPITGDAGKINSALTAIMRGAIRDVESVGQNLESKTPDPAMASATLERAINVVRSLADTYKGAGDEYISEKLAAVHNRLVWFKVALDDHDPNKRMTLKQVAEATDPEKEPFKERIMKIEDELK